MFSYHRPQIIFNFNTPPYTISVVLVHNLRLFLFCFVFCVGKAMDIPMFEIGDFIRMDMRCIEATDLQEREKRFSVCDRALYYQRLLCAYHVTTCVQ